MDKLTLIVDREILAKRVEELEQRLRATEALVERAYEDGFVSHAIDATMLGERDAVRLARAEWSASTTKQQLDALREGKA